jgi:hypothetical protein
MQHNAHPSETRPTENRARFFMPTYAASLKPGAPAGRAEKTRYFLHTTRRANRQKIFSPYLRFKKVMKHCQA